jgi:2-polyprenyl-3-methyl-5-hydroxy-6-metoxy-1,4-benzoquinol methylase
MSEKELYQRAWSKQREREQAALTLSPIARLKRRYTLTRYQLVETLLAGKISGALLDVGCGRGEVILRLEPHFERLCGIDIVEDELQILMKQVSLHPKRDKFLFKSCNLNATWPIESRSFDVVTCIAVLEHLFDPYFVLDEMDRVLRPGGMLIIEVPNIAYLKYRLQILCGVFPPTSGDPVGWDGGHLHYFTLKSLSELVESRGFRVLSARGAGVLAGLRSVWPSMLTSDVCILCRK